MFSESGGLLNVFGKWWAAEWPLPEHWRVFHLSFMLPDFIESLKSPSTDIILQKTQN